MSSTPKFTATDIVECILEHVDRDDVESVVGCMAWLSNARVISALGSKSGGSKIVICDSRNGKSRKWPTALDVRIYSMGGRGRYKPIMHHKFIVGLNVTGDPLWVITGSFNMTQHATRNRENVIALYDPLAIQAYLSEFLSIWTESQRKAPRKRAQAAPKKKMSATTAKN